MLEFRLLSTPRMMIIVSGICFKSFEWRTVTSSVRHQENPRYVFGDLRLPRNFMSVACVVWAVLVSVGKVYRESKVQVWADGGTGEGVDVLAMDERLRSTQVFVWWMSASTFRIRSQGTIYKPWTHGESTTRINLQASWSDGKVSPTRTWREDPRNAKTDRPLTSLLFFSVRPEGSGSDTYMHHASIQPRQIPFQNQ